MSVDRVVTKREMCEDLHETGSFTVLTHLPHLVASSVPDKAPFSYRIVKNEILKAKIVEDDNDLLLITKCAHDSKFDILTIQRPALAIIKEIMFFVSKAIKKLKNDDLFIEHLRLLKNREIDNTSLSIKVKKEMKKEAETLIWILGNEKIPRRTITNENIIGKSQSSDTYDLTISYSYINKEPEPR
ncbi:unnamed protein product, partial [Didymodactylos carnosus]